MKHAPGDSLASRLSALSEPVRLRVLGLLEGEELSVGEVARVVQLPQSTVSRHLKILLEAGWVLKRAVGTATLYRLDPEGLEPCSAAIWAPVRATIEDTHEWTEDRERLAAVLAERPGDSEAFFGRIAGEWDALRRDLFGDRFTIEMLLGLVPPDWVVADLGCGTGDVAARLGPMVEGVVAIDRSDAMLAAARKRLEGVGHVRFVEAPLEALPIPDGSVDAAVCSLVLHHVEEPAGAIAEMLRVVRTGRGGGVALVVDMLPHQRSDYRHTMGHRHLGFEPERVAGWMRDAGFDRVVTRRLTREPGGKGPGLFAASGWKTRAESSAPAGDNHADTTRKRRRQ